MARSYKELVEDLKFTHYPSLNKNFRERVLIVHFFGGNQTKLNRHIRLLNSLGLDVYSFDFGYSKNKIYPKFPMPFVQDFQIQLRWFKELRDVFDYVPGPVILYSFSGPSSCSIKLASEDFKGKISGQISDSGPFTHIYKCNTNLAQVEFGFKNFITKPIAAAVITLLWNINHTKDLVAQLSRVKKGLAYLSLQGRKDEVVPIEYIKDVFLKSNHKLVLTEIEFLDSGHLDSLKKEPTKYKNSLEQWLNRHFKKLV